MIVLASQPYMKYETDICKYHFFCVNLHLKGKELNNHKNVRKNHHTPIL